MTGKLRILKLDTFSDVKREFEKIGVDPGGINLMIPKIFQLNIRINNLSAPAALILKQEMLSLGGDCANHRMVLKRRISMEEDIHLNIMQQILSKIIFQV